MGRYYSTANNDFDGKFWFGVQPSDDPERVYGMRPSASYDDESFVDYDADDNDSDKIMTELDKQFNYLGVPKDKRRYKFENSNETGAYVWDELTDYYLQDEEHKGEIPYSMGDDQRKWPISKERMLAASRVQLGLNILNDIRKHGECQMTAEF